MTLHRRLIPTVVVVAALTAFTARAEAPSAQLGTQLERVWNRVQADETIVAWVFLRDKGVHTDKAQVPRDVVSERSIRRRLKVRDPEEVVDSTDLPLDAQYVAAVRSRVTRLRQRSKWFNAVSVEATRAQLTDVMALPFVRELELVARSRREELPEPVRKSATPAPPKLVPFASNLHDYGNALNQLEQIRVTDLHNLGLDGSDVVVGHFDNGHRLLTHEVFSRLHIVATWDFVDHDPDPAPAPTAPLAFGAHGIATLSILAGYEPGKLIGPAFGASYILARTENDASETPIEEDNWVAAIEWADSIGVDVTSTSLGYRNYDTPWPDWTWQSMNGNTTLITRAADLAAERGIVVVNAVGNGGFAVEPNTMVAPADGDFVIAVGSVDADGVRAGSSAYGPTVDGRTKPDVLAQGAGTWLAVTSNTNAYGTAGGTSLAAPLVAGAAALLLQAHPGATPLEIRDALRLTASRAESVDRLEGWGIIDALAAHRYLIDAGPDPGSPYASRLARVVRERVSGPGKTIQYKVPAPSHVTLRIYNVRGRLVRQLLSTPQSADEYEIRWNGLDDGGRFVGSGVYFLRLRLQPLAGEGQSLVDTHKLSVVR
jgi:subtilisin family serine protease